MYNFFKVDWWFAIGRDVYVVPAKATTRCTASANLCEQSCKTETYSKR